MYKVPIILKYIYFYTHIKKYIYMGEGAGEKEKE